MIRDTAKERIERKERRKGERKARARATLAKETEVGGMRNVSRGLNRFVVTVDTVGYGVTRRLNATNGKDVARWNLVQWYQTRHILLSLTLDPPYRTVFKE